MANAREIQNRIKSIQSPVPALAGTGIQVRQSCPFGCIYFDSTLFGNVGCLEIGRASCRERV